MPLFECHPAFLKKPVGTAHLLPGQAISVRPTKASMLRILSGRAWVTTGVGDGTPEGSGDRFLGPGDWLAVAARAWVVIEPLFVQRDVVPVHFDWAEQLAAPSRFERDVASPCRELLAALALAGSAFTRVLKGLLGYGRVPVTMRCDAQ